MDDKELEQMEPFEAYAMGYDAGFLCGALVFGGMLVLVLAIVFFY